MTRRFENKVAFVTGAAQGQGNTHALRLAAEGADIVAVDMMPTDAEAFQRTIAGVEAEGRGIAAWQCDVRDGEALGRIAQDAMARFGRLDIVLANAGILGPAGPFLDVPYDQMRATMEINFMGVWNTCQATLPHLIAGERGGAIIITSSLYGLKAKSELAAYVSSKHAVVGLMRSLAIEFGRYDIRVNSVHPTTVLTPMLEAATPVGDADNVARLHDMHVLPISWMESDDVTSAILFLASDEARFMTGVAMPIDAGASIK